MDAIQEARSQHIHLEKREGWVCHELVGAKTPTLAHHSLGHEIGIAIHLCKAMIHVAERVLEHMLLQVAHFPIHVKPFVDGILSIAHATLPKELRLAVVRIPTTVLDAAPKKIIHSRHKKRVGLRPMRQHGSHLVTNLRRRTFVCIKTENPVMRGMPDGFVSQFPEAIEIVLKDLAGEFAADCFSCIGAVRVHDHDFVGPGEGLHTPPYIRLIVVCDDHRRHLG